MVRTPPASNSFRPGSSWERWHIPSEPVINQSLTTDSARVFLGYSQEDLDRAYDQDVWAPDGAAIQARILAASAEVSRRFPPASRRYGPADRQWVDIFAPAAPAGTGRAPVLVMIHGGAWRMAMREAFGGPASWMMSAGCILVVVGFECLPAISMVGMAAQLRQALVWVAREIGAFGGDPRNLHLIGHSSGAHMAAVLMTTDWGALDLPDPGLKSATLLSGLYDLHPVMLSARGRYMGLSPDEVTALSPMRHLDSLSGAVTVAWGSRESPEFRRQSEVFASALEGMGKLTRRTMMQDRNHFETLEALNDAEHPLSMALLADIGA
jgi:arylformamidase